MSFCRSTRAIVMVIALAICASLTGATQTQPAKTTTAPPAALKLPDTTPAKYLGEWLAMCSAPNLEQLTKWSAEHYTPEIFKFIPAEKIAQNDVHDCNQSGGYCAVEVVDSKPERIRVLVVSNKTDA